MKAKRRRHDPEFKARGALEALKAIIGDLTVKLEFMAKKSKQLGL